MFSARITFPRIYYGDAVFFKTLKAIKAAQKRSIGNEKIIRLINLGTQAHRLFIHPHKGIHRPATTRRAKMRKGIGKFSFQKVCITQDGGCGDCALAGAGMDSYLFHHSVRALQEFSIYTFVPDISKNDIKAIDILKILNRIALGFREQFGIYHIIDNSAKILRLSYTPVLQHGLCHRPILLNSKLSAPASKLFTADMALFFKLSLGPAERLENEFIAIKLITCVFSKNLFNRLTEINHFKISLSSFLSLVLLSPSIPPQELQLYSKRYPSGKIKSSRSLTGFELPQLLQ